MKAHGTVLVRDAVAQNVYMSEVSTEALQEVKQVVIRPCSALELGSATTFGTPLRRRNNGSGHSIAGCCRSNNQESAEDCGSPLLLRPCCRCRC
jgi:hypothetical protein